VTVGVIAHIENPSFDQVRQLARTAEQAGADWLGVADAFWWRDTWLLLTEAARVTERIRLGPLVTNPYLRHPFVTVSALASLQDLAGPRVFAGIGAGGSEIRLAARISRADAPERIDGLASLIRSVAAGGPLDTASGRRLDIGLLPVPIIVGARSRGVLRAAGRVADDVLLWAVPKSDLDRSVETVHQGYESRATSRAGNGHGSTVSAAGAGPLPYERPFPGLIWAPMVRGGEHSEALLSRAATYAVLNNSAALRESWGVAPGDVDRIRQLLVAGRPGDAAGLVPQAVFDDLAIERDIDGAGTVAARIGATGMAVAATDLDVVPDQVEWAREVLAAATARIKTADQGTPGPAAVAGLRHL
jgi:alkanesulfonate monooxygenase SsuD/methylene tetrahydromethanopterin reductase-like flavin-dependent oxidoreductase (luciferase family)